MQLAPQRRVRLRRHPDPRAHAAARHHLHRAQLQARPRRQRRARLLLVQLELPRVQGQPVLEAPVGRALAQPRQAPPRLLGERLRILDHQGRVGGQVIEERAHVRVEDRRQRLDPEELLAALDLLQQVARLRRGQGRRVRRRQHLAARIGARRDDGLAHRVEHHRVQRAQGPLRAGVIQTDRLDLVAE